MTLKNRKYIANYDIGKNLVISSGRQSTTSVDTNQFGAMGLQSGYDNAASTYRSTILPSTMSSLAGIGSTALNFMLNYTTQSAANAANIASATTKGFIDSAGKWTDAGIKALGSNAGNLTTESIATAKDAATSLGSNAAQAGLSAAGYITGALGTAMGLHGMITGALNYKNRVQDTDMLAGASQSTQSKFGRTYNQIGGFDERGILNYTNAQNTADNTNMAMQGLNTGLSAGATIGTAVGGPVGTAIGAAIGGLGGLLTGGIFGNSRAKRRKRRVLSDIANTKEAIGGYNTQSEAVAGSEGLRDMYNAYNTSPTTGILRADKGKNTGKSGKGPYTKIETENGTEYGMVQGYAQPREGIVNASYPSTHYLGSVNPGVKEPRVDNIPVGSNNNFDSDFILGNKPYEGKKGNPTYADLGRNALKLNEVINLKREAGQATQEDERIYMRNWNYLRSLGESLKNSGENKSLTRRGLRKFAKGLDYRDLEPIAGFAAKIPAMVNERNIIGAKTNIPVVNTTNNSARSALNILGGLGYNPSSALTDLTRAAVLNRYNINQTGALSAGLKAALTSSSNNQLAAQRRAILEDAYNKNATYKAAYANALMSAGEAQANRNFKSSEMFKDDYIKQNASYITNMLQHNKNNLMQFNQLLQDLSTNKYQNKLLDLYDQLMDIERLKAFGNLNNSSVQLNNSSVQLNSYKSTYSPPFYSDLKTPVTYPTIPMAQKVNNLTQLFEKKGIRGYNPITGSVKKVKKYNELPTIETFEL